MEKPAKVILPIVFLFASLAVVAVLMKFKKKPDVTAAPPKAVLVDVVTVESRSEPIVIKTQGTVEPLFQTVLIPEVSGSIVGQSKNFKAGGFFEKGDVLVEIDPSNYESAVAQARFNLEQARLRLEQEKARAEQALKEWSTLGEGEAPPLAVREPQLRAEQANVAWAQEALDRALRDLERTKIRAPYSGMVREQNADLGQFVAPGTQLGVIFSIESAEIRLPLSLDELAFVELPLQFRNSSTEGKPGPTVLLKAKTGGAMHEWKGRIVRTEGTIDPANRMVYAVARVEDPYGRTADEPPLRMGLFVEAEIAGRTLDNVVVLPRSVLRGNNRVLIVTDDRKLESRQVSVLRANPTSVIISQGLHAGEMVCTTALDFVVEGMQVEIVGDAKPLETAEDDSVAEIAPSEGKSSL